MYSCQPLSAYLRTAPRSENPVATVEARGRPCVSRLSIYAFKRLEPGPLKPKVGREGRSELSQFIPPDLGIRGDPKRSGTKAQRWSRSFGAPPIETSANNPDRRIVVWRGHGKLSENTITAPRTIHTSLGAFLQFVRCTLCRILYLCGIPYRYLPASLVFPPQFFSSSEAYVQIFISVLTSAELVLSVIRH